MFMDDLTKQVEEIEALSSIYGEEFQIEDEENRKYSIKIVKDCDVNIYVILYFKFLDSYPSTSPPTYEISAPHLKQEQKVHLGHLIEDVYLSNIGQSVIFQWIETIREELNSMPIITTNKLDDFSEIESEIPRSTEESTIVCPIVTHGEVILDRKSTFQGHVATVFSLDEVKQVIMKLKENKKIQQATHNIYAYRIHNKITNSFLHDCDDDGETQAGSRLLHLLEIMDVKNVVVIVSRWYGGIHLGPDRFRHINNAARQVLITANLLPSK